MEDSEALRFARRFLIPHILGWAAASLALAAVPYTASRVSWGLSSLLGFSAGLRIYEVGWGSSRSSVDDKHAVVDPRSSGVLGVLCVVSAICIAGDFGRRRFPFLSWGLPVLPALAVAVWTSSLTRGDAAVGSPGLWPFVAGATLGVVVAGVLGAYWAVFLLSSRVALRSG